MFFFEKHVRLFFRKHVREFMKTRTCFSKKDDGDIQAIRILYNKPNNQLFFKV